MAKQSAPIQEVSRLLDLVPFLSTHSYISLKELATEFGVGERAMAAELTALSMCGLPGYTPYELIEINFDSGFVSINNHEALDIPRALNKVEIASLLIGLRLLRDIVKEDQISALAKIDELSGKLNALLGANIEIEPTPDFSRLAEISKGIANRSTFKITYTSPLNDGNNEREISPLSIYSQGAHTYVEAYCHSAGAVRNFRSDRISAIRKIETKSAPDVEPAAAPKISLSLQVSGRRRAIAELLELETIPASGEISIDVFSEAWIEKAVIAYSPDLVVLHPDSAKQAVKASIANILALYR
jgi:proteasome accessory factor C